MEYLLEVRMNKSFFTNLVCYFLIFSLLLTSCSPQLASNKKIEKEKLLSESSRLINQCYSDVRAIMIKEGEYSEEEFNSHGILDGEELTRNLYQEENGKELLELLCLSQNAEDVDEVLSKAKGFLDKDQYNELENKSREVEKKFKEEGKRIARGLNPGEKEQFYKDLRSVTVKSIVLLTAAIVYACIPKVMFWGKVSAASAVSIAAGVVASTLITILEWSDKDLQQDSEAFKNWLDNVTSEPIAAWALAQGVINTQSAISTNYVTGALVLFVFAIYHITDGTKKLLKEYNWRV